MFQGKNPWKNSPIDFNRSEIMFQSEISDVPSWCNATIYGPNSIKFDLWCKVPSEWNNSQSSALSLPITGNERKKSAVLWPTGTVHYPSSRESTHYIHVLIHFAMFILLVLLNFKEKKSCTSDTVVNPAILFCIFMSNLYLFVLL